MNIVLAIVAIIISLIMVIGIHEAGHAIAARLFKVKIKRISIGFGKPLISYTNRSGLEWAWGRWPLGGYVQLLNSRIEPVSKRMLRYCFDKQAVWKRIVILIAGGAANILLAFFLLSFYYSLGYPQMSPVIATVAPASAAALAGVNAGDQFISIAGQRTESWRKVGRQLTRNLGQSTVPVVLQSASGIPIKTNLDLSQWEYNSRTNALLLGLGMQPDMTITHRYIIKGAPFLQALYKAMIETIHTLSFFLITLKLLFTGVIPFAALLGPVGLFSLIVASFSQGVAVYLYFMAYLSLAVGLINLFPVPGLDGGSIVYSVVEKIRGKPVSVPLEILLQRLALIAFCVALVQLLMNDLLRYGQ